MLDDLIKVSKEDFFNYVNPRDICVHVVHNKLTEWKTRNGNIVGVTEYYDDDLTDKQYFLKKKFTVNMIPKLLNDLDVPPAQLLDYNDRVLEYIGKEKEYPFFLLYKVKGATAYYNLRFKDVHTIQDELHNGLLKKVL